MKKKQKKLEMFEKRVLRKIFGPKIKVNIKYETAKTWKNNTYNELLEPCEYANNSSCVRGTIIGQRGNRTRSRDGRARRRCRAHKMRRVLKILGARNGEEIPQDRQWV